MSISRSLTLIFAALAVQACSRDVIQHGAADASQNTHEDADLEGDAEVSDADNGDGGPAACVLSATPAPIELHVRAGESTSAVVTIQNTGSSACDVTMISVDPAGELGLVSSPLPRRVPPGGTLMLEVSYAPIDEGTDNAVLRLSAASGNGVALEVQILGFAGPANLPPIQTVTFSITNNSAAPIYVTTEGYMCTAFDPGVETMLGFQCICECANPGRPSPSKLHEIAAGATYDLTWDGLEMKTFTQPFDCASVGFPGAPPLDRLLASFQPAAPGAHRVTIAFERTVPFDCLDFGGGEYSCQRRNGPIGTQAGLIADICPSTETVAVDYVLPASGDLTVPITVP